MPYFARRKDSTHQAVLDALRAYGWSVMDVARAPLCIDLVIAKAGRVVLVEVKDRTGKLTEAQKALLASWPGETAVLRSLEDVARLTADITREDVFYGILPSEKLKNVEKRGRTPGSR